ncbi:MAG TPA: isoprenylcysteine carboxylmethyltransferase family protein [Rhodanobacteraceae bacterium]
MTPALIAESRFYTIVLNIAVVVCFAPEFYRSWLRKLDAQAVNRDRGSHGVVLVAIGLGVGLAVYAAHAALPHTTIAWQQQWVFWFGITLMFAGFAYRHYAIHVLGKFFTHTVATRPGQYVVDTGPYRLLRHPSYTGSLVTMIGLGLALTNGLSVVLMVLGAGVGYGWRIHVEERALCADLGEPYREYMRHTSRLIPHVW